MRNRPTLVRMGAVVMCLVTATGACATQKDEAAPIISTESNNFAEATATSGCPSPECSEILAKVAEGAEADIVPENLTPSVADSAKGLVSPPDRQCSQLPVPSTMPDWQGACVYPTVAVPTAPAIVVIGDSQAFMWSTAVVEMAKQLGYRAGAVWNGNCRMPEVPFETTKNGVTDEECRAWRAAAINWANEQDPAVVLVASGYAEPVSGIYTKGYVATLKKLGAPGRKVFVMGDVPNLAENPPQCLAENMSSATRCATPTNRAAPPVQQEEAFVASEKASGYVNLTPLACTAAVCPAIVGNTAVYKDQYNFTSTYAQSLTPVIMRALGLTPVG